METIQIPKSEYNSLKEQIELLKDSELMQKVNRLLDLLYQEKYGLYMGDVTNDLAEYNITNNWENISSRWDEV